MEKFVITGGTPLKGSIMLGGAKNVALKICVASLLTDDELILHNVPRISDVSAMFDVLKSLGVTVNRQGSTVRIKHGPIKSSAVPLEVGARLRTSSMVLGPLLARVGIATVPNPGGCRIGARPIDRHIGGLQQMGATITYVSEDGFFHARAQSLHGITYTFEKNTHTGTETLILAAVLARGTTVLKNAAEEVEIDDLIVCLVSMGARIKRTAHREITIEGVSRLHGTEYSIMPDRNEEVTFAISAMMTGGDITVVHSQQQHLRAFFDALDRAGGGYEKISGAKTRYFAPKKILPTDIVTVPHPGFMTDWQAPWAVLMTQANGVSTIHETVFESRFSYVKELIKMGAAIEHFDPQVANPAFFYNFNLGDRAEDSHQAIRIMGPTKLHNAILDIDDLRAGATLVLAALAAQGQSSISGIEQIDRGYEKIEERLRSVGAHIERVKE